MKSKVLIVDDEPVNLATMESFLVDDGYELLFASTGAEACAVARERQPDLILLDVMMPEVDGFAATRLIRGDPVISRIPIMIVTALHDERSRLEGLRAGADDILTKPCAREEIRARVRSVVSLNRFRLIAEQRARFERLFEASPAAIVVVDPAGTVVAANPMARSCEVGAPVWARYDEACATTLRALVGDAFRSDQPPARELRCGHGAEEKIFSARGVPVPEDGGKLAMLVLHNVTEEVRAREALARANAELEDRVRARTAELERSNGLLMSYANFVSHDLRSPLTVVKAYLSMIQDGLVPINADAAPVVDQAYSGTLMMEELIENILQLARDEHARGSGDRPPVSTDPTRVIDRLVMRMRDLFPKPAPRFVVGPLPRVGVSPVLVERVFYNLLSNALKYSAGREQPTVEIGATVSAEGPVLFVRDNGVGFTVEDRQRLFQAFTRLSTAGSAAGIGLGLSLVARLLSANGGQIWAEGEPGVGAIFYVQFPPPAPA